MDDAEWGKWFEGIWATREEKIYPKYFGDTISQIYNLPEEVFKIGYGMEEFDPSWLTNIVIEYPPDAERNSWLYVTSGLSNPIGQEPEDIKPEDFSGMGFEMIIETTEKSFWPVQVLHRLMGYQILVSTSHIEGELLDYHTIIPFGEGVTEESKISNFVIVEPEENRKYPSEFSLISGVVDMFVLFGVTQEEVDSLPDGVETDIIHALLDQTEFPITNVTRDSIKFKV